MLTGLLSLLLLSFRLLQQSLLLLNLKFGLL
ncbi:Uncharacterised protein [Vibrio cholerae]|nr:Uncharacterised protein [Vibrio cholerae]